MEIIIAGGGVAGLEGLLALHRMLGDGARLTLIAPDPDFTYRPLAVAEPFGLGHAHRVPLKRFAEETGPTWYSTAWRPSMTMLDRSGWSGAGRAASTRCCWRPAAVRWRAWREPRRGSRAATETYGGLLRDLEEGYVKRLAIVVPPGSVWPLPGYELALATAGEAKEMGQADLTITVVTPEHEPLSLFGEEASRAVAEELGWAGIQFKTGVVARRDGDGIIVEPSGERLDVQRVFAVPRIVGPAIEGVACDDEGFLVADDNARVEGCERTWAAGDGIVSPVNFGGLATHQARRAAAAIAGIAGVDVPDPGEPVLHGRLLVGHRSRRLAPSGGAEGAPLWWPHGKVAGEHLPRWLAEHGVAPPAAEEPPDEDGVTIRRPLSEMRGPEALYLHELARQYRTSDPAIAALGRRMREARERSAG